MKYVMKHVSLLCFLHVFLIVPCWSYMRQFSLAQVQPGKRGRSMLWITMQLQRQRPNQTIGACQQAEHSLQKSISLIGATCVFL